jgi:hypothetical protein
VRPCRGVRGYAGHAVFHMRDNMCLYIHESKVYLWGVLVNAIEYWEILFEKALR